MTRREPVTELRLERHAAVVERDLPTIYGHIAADNPAAAEDVLDAVEQTFQQIAQHPNSGVAYPTRNPKLRDLRMVPIRGFSDYLVFYRAEATSVRILYVTHGARNLFRLFRREFRQ